jgi:hypothetical protein
MALTIPRASPRRTDPIPIAPCPAVQFNPAYVRSPPRPRLATTIVPRPHITLLIQEVIARDSIVARRRPIADFFNSIGQTRSLRDVRSMSGLPESGSVLRQLLANAAIAASRVGS